MLFISKKLKDIDKCIAGFMPAIFFGLSHAYLILKEVMLMIY